MKILTLAAGLGTRVSGVSELPKPLIEVAGRTILEWSLRSFHRCQAAALVGPADYIIAMQRAHIEEFQMEELVSCFEGKKASLIAIDGITAGPAETAFHAMRTALAEGILSPDEPIIINDCDHFFNSGSVFRGVEELATGDQKKLMLFEAKKEEDDLSWSFVERQNGAVLGVKEKPSRLEVANINLGLGLAGVYGWSSAGEFMDLYSRVFASQADDPKERYISAVADFAVKSGWTTMIGSIQDFVPLGNPHQIEVAEENSLLASGFQEPGTLFIDIDGTVVEHDPGYFSSTGRYRSQLKPLDPSVLESLTELAAQGLSIVLVSSRPLSQEEFLRANFSRLGIKFDRLILGLSGGARYLVNDSKPKLIGFSTAVAINVERNGPDFLNVRNAVERNEKLRVGEDFGGESGAVTRKVISEGFPPFIRKTSLDSTGSRELMRYQANWYQHIGNLTPNVVPRVLKTQFGDGDARWSFDTEFLPGIEPVYKFARSQPQKSVSLFVGNLSRTLEGIYSAHLDKEAANAGVLVEVLREKSLTGYKRALHMLRLALPVGPAEFFDGLGLVPDITSILEELSTGGPGYLSEALDRYKSPVTLIHGDPTLGNLQVTEGSIPVMLDPVGARIDPGFVGEFGWLGRSLPLFDWARIELSSRHNYDSWNESLSLEGKVLVESDPNSKVATVREELSSFWDHWAPADPRVRSMAMLTTATRIMPYKAVAGKFSEVVALMRVAATYAEEFRRG